MTELLQRKVKVSGEKEEGKGGKEGDWQKAQRSQSREEV